MGAQVTIDNFARAESDRMFATLAEAAGGVNLLGHNRAPTPIDNQPVIRMNRDTLYSSAIVDISEGATVTIPESGDRYTSVMVVNQDHFINRVLHEPGEHELTVAEHETPWALVGVRILVDPSDPADVAEVNALQDRFGVEARSSKPFELPDYDTTSFDATRAALLELAKHSAGFEHSFGKRSEVDPVRHLISTAAGWGGLPDSEARYEGILPNRPVGAYELTVGDVPVDGFWSVSVYNAGGFFEPNDRNAYSVNDITAKPNDDGTVTIRFGGCDTGLPNCIPITDGWNYIVRLYRPRAEILDGSWRFPEIEPA
jgi:hypothetical protein